MIIRVGLENNMDGHSLAWALDFPGCFADGTDATAALVNLPQRLLVYEHWVDSHVNPPWFELGNLDIRLVETWDGYFINDEFEVIDGPEGYEVNAFYRDDWRPLKQEDIEHGLALLSWTRADLQAAAADLSCEILDKTYPGERWSIQGILRHVANADWWYLSRLGLTDGQVLPEDTNDRLQATRSRLEKVLPELAGVKKVVGVDGELWSPRKLLRRALWHERDHTGHIYKLLAGA
jgi:hypothetical protein